MYCFRILTAAAVIDTLNKAPRTSGVNLAMVQAAGRVVRTPDDWAEIAILDSGFASLLRRPELFPKWFLEAVEVNGRKPPQRVVPTASSMEIEGS
jgi:hypothetical protein